MNKILVTGSSGFLGQYVTAQIHQSKLGEVLVAPLVNLASLEQASDLFRKTRPDYVIHCATKVGGIHDNASRPADFFADNMVMGLNIVGNCGAYGVKKLTFVSTTCAYPNHCPIPFKVADLWNGYPEPTNA